jgi:hypothetical protein
LPRPGTTEHESFKKDYLARTGYAYGEQIPLAHALQLFSGIERPSRAREEVTRWLAAGIPALAHKKAIKAFLKGEGEFVPKARPFNPAEIKEFFARNQDGFNSYNFLHWAVTLAQTKAAIGATARRKNLEKARREKKRKEMLDVRTAHTGSLATHFFFSSRTFFSLAAHLFFSSCTFFAL